MCVQKKNYTELTKNELMTETFPENHKKPQSKLLRIVTIFF